MTTQHDLDDMFPAGIDDGVEHELRQLFAAARAPAATEELAAEASVVAAMSEIVHCQMAMRHVTRRRIPLRRVVASRTAKVAMITGFAVMSTSAAVAAGVLPQPVQSVFDRAVRIASWPNSDHEPAAAVPDDPEPTTITETTEVPDAIARATMPASSAVDRETDAQALCGRWAASIRSGVEVDADANAALGAVAARAGVAVERLCGPSVPTPDVALPSPQETPPEEAVPPSTVPTVDPTNVPTTDVPPAPIDDGTPKATPTSPPQADGNGPPVSDPSPIDEGNDRPANGTPNANANANANGSANANGGNANANSNAGAVNPNANGNGAGANGNANVPTTNGAGANGNANGATTNGAGANVNTNGGNQNPHGGGGDHNGSG